MDLRRLSGLYHSPLIEASGVHTAKGRKVCVCVCVCVCCIHRRHYAIAACYHCCLFLPSPGLKAFMENSCCYPYSIAERIDL